jgi:hypothetical protein
MFWSYFKSVTSCLPLPDTPVVFPSPELFKIVFIGDIYVGERLWESIEYNLSDWYPLEPLSDIPVGLYLLKVELSLSGPYILKLVPVFGSIPVWVSSNPSFTLAPNKLL